MSDSPKTDLLQGTLERLTQSGRGSRGRRPANGATPAAVAAAIGDLEKRLTTHLGARVAIHHSPKRGRIVIAYAGNDDLQRILEKIGLEPDRA